MHSRYSPYGSTNVSVTGSDDHDGGGVGDNENRIR